MKFDFEDNSKKIMQDVGNFISEKLKTGLKEEVNFRYSSINEAVHIKDYNIYER